MAFHIPEQPNVNTPIESWYWLGWFKDTWNWAKRTSDISAIKTTSFSVTDCNFYPVNTTGGAVTATLPLCLGIRGRTVVIKRTAGANNVSIVVSGSDTIEGAGSYSLTAIGDAVEVVSDGNSKWYIRALGGSGGIPSGSPLTTKGDLWGFAAVDARVPVGLDGKVLTADSGVANGVSWQTPAVGTPGGADTNIQYNDSGVFGGEADFTWNKTTNTLTLSAASSVLNFSGNIARITGIFTNATHSNRTLFQNNVSNATTNIGVLPSGSGNTAVGIYYGNSNPDAAQAICRVGQTGTVSILDANVINAGTQGTMEIRIGASPAITIDANRNASVGIASLATNATNGFPYIPSCAGTPIGVPTAITGFAPLVADSTNNKFYFYTSGAWQTAGGLTLGDAEQCAFFYGIVYGG